MARPSLWFRASLVGVLGVAVVGSTLALSRRDYTFFDPLIDVERIIAQRYVVEPDLKAMQQAAITGMVEALNDPYTVYVPPTETGEFNKELTGDFVGIGVQVVTRDGWLTVVSPLEDTPAFKAGIQAEDKIVEIEGKSTFGLSSDECIALLTGQAGTPVKIVIERGGLRKPMTILRERIVTRTVRGFHYDAPAAEEGGAGQENTGKENADGKPADGRDASGVEVAKPEAASASGSWQYFLDPQRRIAYLRLSQFTPTSADEITQTLEALGAREGKLGGLIIDLRWNPGGVLSDAVQISDLFLEDGVIVSTKGRSRQEEVARAEKDGTLPDFPLVLLINSGSASASEVVAGALTENKRAIAVGTRTFGKGSVQTVVTLPSGQGQLKVTEQKYYLPSGRSIHRLENSTTWGVDPTEGFYVPMTEEETRAMLDVRRQEDVIGIRRKEDAANWSRPEWIVERLKDPQLAAALRAAQGKVDSGEWKPTGQALPQGNQLAVNDLERLSRMRERMEKELARLDRRIAALEDAGVTETRTPLFPAQAALTGGRVEVFDKDGKPIASLSITGPDLERWLQEADVKKVEPAKEPSKEPAKESDQGAGGPSK